MTWRNYIFHHTHKEEQCIGFVIELRNLTNFASKSKPTLNTLHIDCSHIDQLSVFVFVCLSLSISLSLLNRPHKQFVRITIETRRTITLLFKIWCFIMNRKRARYMPCVRINKLGQLNELNNLTNAHVRVWVVALTSVGSIEQSP